MSTPAESPEGPAGGVADRLGIAFDLERQAEAAPEGADVDAASEAPEEPEATPESEDVEQPEREEEEQEAEASEEEAAEEPEAEAEAKPTDEEGTEIATLDDMDAAFQVGKGEFAKNVQVEVGEEKMTLADALERAAQAPAPAQMAQMLAERRQVEEEASAERQKTYQERDALFFGVLNTLLGKAETTLGFSKAQLDAMRETDPEGWAIKAEDARQFYAELDAAVAAAKEHQGKRSEEDQAILQKRHEEEGNKLIAAVPEWRAIKPDDEAGVQRVIDECTEISEWVQENYNFTAEEMADMPDHRLALVFRDLFQKSKTVQKRSEIKQTLRLKKKRAPQTVIPTSPKRAPVDTRAKARAAAKKRQRETAGDPNRVKEHEEAAAERLGDLL